MDTKFFDEKLKELACDFDGREGLSVSNVELEKNIGRNSGKFLELSPQMKIDGNREYFFELLKNLFCGEIQDVFFVYGKDKPEMIEKAKADLGENLYNILLNFKASNLLDFVKQKIQFTKFNQDELFHKAMQNGSYEFDLPFVQGKVAEVSFKNGEFYEKVCEERVKVEGAIRGETHFMGLKQFWPEGIITEDGTFYMTPKMGKHEILSQFLSLMGENMYNAIRVYNTSNFTKFDWYNERETTKFVNGGKENIGILFSNMQDYISNDYSDFMVSDAQAKTMLALYHISSKIYNADNVRRGIHYLYQDCIENSQSLFKSTTNCEQKDMNTKSLNLSTISDVAKSHFGEGDYNRNMQMSTRFKIC